MLIERRDVDRALESGEFLPHFQPLVSLSNGELHGFELLARWKHPKKGLIAPDQFIPVAERDGWIGALTGVLLQQGFRAMCALSFSSRLSVNISAIQLHDLNLPDQIENIAKQCGFAMDRLTVEVTETALADDVERALVIVNALKAMGCKLALDDFGTGYSSLSHLQSLPFDELKVDRSFVSAMAERRDSRKIVAAVVGLGQSLGLTTTAEGVETQEQVEMLRWLGCEWGQGWLFGKATAMEGLDEVIAGIRQRAPFNSPSEIIGRVSRSSLDWHPSMRLAQLQAVYDGAPVGLAFLDRNLRYMNINRTLANMNGRPMAEHLGRTVSEIIPELFPKVEPYIRRALAGESIPGVEITKPTTAANGGKTILLSYEPARDEAGEVLGVSVALVDLTPMKRAQEAQSESEIHFRHMLELMPQIPWIIDAEGRALDVSLRWLELTGMTDDQWRGYGWLDALHPDDRQSTWDAMQRAFGSASPIDLYYRVRRSENDPWKRLRSRGSPRIGPDGKIICWYGCLEVVG